MKKEWIYFIAGAGLTAAIMTYNPSGLASIDCDKLVEHMLLRTMPEANANRSNRTKRELQLADYMDYHFVAVGAKAIEIYSYCEAYKKDGGILKDKDS